MMVNPKMLKADKYKKFTEMVSDYNYPIEKHFYETEDKYVNCVFRISGPRGTRAIDNAKLPYKKPVIIYQHGFADSCATICSDGLESMAFIFADAGFDIWMNNTRGNKFSRHHRYLDPGVHKAFWNFSYQEMAQYD